MLELNMISNYLSMGDWVMFSLWLGSVSSLVWSYFLIQDYTYLLVINLLLYLEALLTVSIEGWCGKFLITITQMMLSNIYPSDIDLLSWILLLSWDCCCYKLMNLMGNFNGNNLSFIANALFGIFFNSLIASSGMYCNKPYCGNLVHSPASVPWLHLSFFEFSMNSGWLFILTDTVMPCYWALILYLVIGIMSTHLSILFYLCGIGWSSSEWLWC